MRRLARLGRPFVLITCLDLILCSIRFNKISSTLKNNRQERFKEFFCLQLRLLSRIQKRPQLHHQAILNFINDKNMGNSAMNNIEAAKAALAARVASLSIRQDKKDAQKVEREAAELGNLRSHSES
jgi:hypothetical protein